MGPELMVSGLLIKSFLIGLVPGLAALIYLVLSLVLKYTGAKQEQDRAEHMVKWNSMVELQDKIVDAQKDNMRAIIDGNREDLNRAYSLYERQAESLEVISHHISTLTTSLEAKSICPIPKKEQS